MNRVFIAALLLWPATVFAQAPHAAVRAGRVILGGLPNLVDEVEVRKRLDSGLTNSFVYSVQAVMESGDDIRGGARIDVRYELWDEVYLVDKIAHDGSSTSFKLASFDELRQWWRKAELSVLPGSSFRAGRPVRLEIEAKFVPFSQSEEAAARDWVADRMIPARPGSLGLESKRSAEVIDLVVATSISRAPVLVRKWEVNLAWE